MARWFARSPVTEPALSLSPHKRSIDRLVIAIINYRSGARLKLCIEKALAAVKELESSLVCQTIVVDNSPDATDLASLMGHFPNEAGLVILHDGQNLGFAGGVERALEGRDWDGVLILNPDVALTGEALKNMLQAVISNQELAAVGATLLNSDFTPQHGFIARRFPTLASTLMEFFFLHKIFPLNRYTAAYLLRDEPRFREYVDCKYSQYPGVPVSALPYLVEQPAGACLMVARDAYQAVGGFDLDFWPAWFEDVDLAKRLRSAGYQLAVCANARVLHEGGYSKESIGDTAFARIWYKNLLRYWKKHGSFIEYSLIRGSLVPALLLRALYSRAHLHVLLDLFSRNDPNS